MLDLAIGYSNTLFSTVLMVWPANSLVSVLRGTGNMRVPSITIVATSAAQVVIGATLGLGLGLGPFPRWGMSGVALGQVLAFSGEALFLLAYSRSTGFRLPLQLSAFRCSANTS